MSALLYFGGTAGQLQRHPARPRVDPLAARAAKLWPDSPAIQAEWMRAVGVVRSTSRGWLLERRQHRLEAAR